MKILGTAWMVGSTGNGWEGYSILENLQDYMNFKEEHMDDVFDIVFEYHLLSNDTPYSAFDEPDSIAEYVDKNNDKKLDESSAKLLLSTKQAFI